MRAFILVVVMICTVGVVSGCTKPNPNRCCTDEADCMTKGIPTGSQCEDGLVCRGNQCIAQPCASSSNCDLTVPYCVDELCSGTCTDDTQCPGFDQADAPYCVDGGCVACRDSTDCPTDTASVCEGASCRACRAHSECASDLCDVDMGTCIGETTIAYAAPNGSTVSACTKADPCTLTRAFSVLDATRTNVKMSPGMYAEYIDRSVPHVAIYGPATMHMLSLRETDARVRDLAILGSLSCSTGSTQAPLSNLDAARVDVTLDGTSAVNANQCNLKLDRVSIHQPTVALAVSIGDRSTLQLSRSAIDSVGACLVFTSTASGIASNSVFRNCAGQGNAGALMGQPVSFEISFSTFHNTFLRCDYPTLAFTIRNSIFLNEGAGAPADTISGAGCREEYSLVKPQSAMLRGVHNTVNVDPRFATAASGDFHLTAGSPAIDSADPVSTEASDFDGTARPQGAARDQGAFEYKP